MPSAQYLRLVGVSSLQGRRDSIALTEECQGATSARVEGAELPFSDLDGDPATFTLDVSGLELGTRTISFDCADELTAGFDLLVYRQTGAERGGAHSIAIATVVALVSTAAVFALPGVRRR